MRVSANSKSLRRRADASDGSLPSFAPTFGKAAHHEDGKQADTSVVAVKSTETDESLLRVMSELSHDLRQPLTSLNMNLQTAVKLLQLPTPQVSGALDALVDCLSTDRDMVELIAHAKRRAAALSHTAPIALNEVARDLLVSARSLEPNWRMRISDRFATPSPMVAGGFVRLRLGLLSILRRTLILHETEPRSVSPVVIETRSIDDRAELRLTGLPRSLPVSPAFQSLHMLITSLVGYLHGHANLTVQDERVSFVVSVPIAPVTILRLPGGRDGV